MSSHSSSRQLPASHGSRCTPGLYARTIFPSNWASLKNLHSTVLTMMCGDHARLLDTGARSRGTGMASATHDEGGNDVAVANSGSRFFGEIDEAMAFSVGIDAAGAAGVRSAAVLAALLLIPRRCCQQPSTTCSELINSKRSVAAPRCWKCL